MPKTTPGTRAIQMAYTRGQKALQRAIDKHGHTPLMHEQVDPRQARKKEHDMMQLDEFIQRGGDSGGPRQDIRKGRAPQPLPKLPASGSYQKPKNRLAGKPEYPNQMETGAAADGQWTTDSSNASYGADGL